MAPKSVFLLMKPLAIAFSVLALALFSTPCFGLISVRSLPKDEAKEMGITMKQRKNGDAGIKVWIEFKKEGFLEKLTYCRLQMNDENGEHLLSAMLRPNPAHHRQPKDVTSFAFSASRDQLANCSFMLVAYGSPRGDVGYVLNVKDYLDLNALK